jgi:hypothetical protein
VSNQAHPKRPKRPRDTNALAFQLMREATGQEPKQRPAPESEMAKRGRKGGLKGGKARARALSPAKRRAAARKAARARWDSRSRG